jgi:ribosomal protein L37AE/L43A
VKIGQEGDTRRFGRLKGDQRQRARELEGDKPRVKHCMICGERISGRYVRVGEDQWACVRCDNES